MKIGYGTYGMPREDIFEAVPRLRAIGYEMLELTAAPEWPTAPAKLAPEQRRRLRETVQQTGFPPLVIMGLLNPCARGAARETMVGEFAALCQLADDLNFGDGVSIVTSTLGGAQPEWESDKAQIVADLVELADIAAQHCAVFAIEPHIGGALDLPHKAKWLMEQANHPALKLNFDYSHFLVQGLDLSLCLDQCLPFAVHSHVKDGHRENGKVRFVLPGAGDFDLTDYFRALQERNCTLPVCVEVSGMVWRQPDYEPWQAARQCFAALNAARAAGIPL